METTDQPKQTKSQKFYQAHKAEIAEKNKEKILCDCGTLITRNNMSKHKKTTTHMLKAKLIKYEFVADEDE
jgi:hypothetical protein